MKRHQSPFPAASVLSEEANTSSPAKQQDWIRINRVFGVSFGLDRYTYVPYQCHTFSKNVHFFLVVSPITEKLFERKKHKMVKLFAAMK